MRDGDGRQLIPLPPALALFHRLRELGKLAAALGMTTNDVLSLPVALVSELQTVRETIDDYREYLNRESNGRNSDAEF